MGMYDKIDAYHRKWEEEHNARCEEQKERLKDVERVDENELNFEEWKQHQVFMYEIKNHLEIGSMTYDDVLYEKGLFTRAELKQLNDGNIQSKK